MALASCNSPKSAGENPFFTQWDTPFGVPPFDKIRAEHFMPAFERGMSLHDAEIDAITSNNDEPTFENTILAYDNAGQMLAQTELIFGMLCAAETNERMQALQEQVMPLLSAHRDKIRLDEKLFARVKDVYDRRASLGLDAEQSRLLRKTYDAFVRSGALLDAGQKARLKEINGELSLTAVKFGNNILAENNNFALELTADDLEGLPSGVRDAAREKAQAMGKGDKWVFTLHKPSLIPFLTYSAKRDLREKIYKAYLNRCNNGDQYDNKQLINDFIRLRTEKAKMLGYPSYAAYVVADEMAGTTDAVYALLDQIWTPALDRAGEELAEMDKLLQKDVPGATFESWDWWYYAENCASRTMHSTRRCCVPISRSKTCRAASSTSPTGFTASPSSPSWRRSTILRRSPTRCSTPTSRIWACSISTSFRVTARVRGRGAATMSNRPTGTASASLPW